MFKIKYKRIVCFMLSCVIMLSTLISTAVTVKADSANSATQRVTNFISLAAGKNIQSLGDDLKLTEDELRFLGVYLSNFYIPFGTELGSTEDETTEQNKEDMKNALSKTLNFNEDLADTFVETIIGLSRSNSVELECRVSKQYHAGYRKLPNFKTNYFNFFRLMTGNARYVFEGYARKYDDDSKLPKVYKDILNSVNTTNDSDRKVRYGYFGYTKGNTFIPMFDFIIGSGDGRNQTASMLTFKQCLGSVDMENGYGCSFFDFTSKEAEDSDELQGMLKDMDPSVVYQMSIYGSTVHVDCFGNIIVKGANHQYIAVPGCMNPYTWVVTNKNGNGKDKGGYKAGVSYNAITFTGMSMADTGTLLGKTQDDKVVKGETLATRYGHVLTTKFDEQYDKIHTNSSWDFGFFSKTKSDILKALFPKNSNSIADRIPFRVLRGSKEYDTGSHTWLTFLNKDIKDVIISAEEGFFDANAKDYSYYAAVFSKTADESVFGSSSADYAKAISSTGSHERYGNGDVRFIDNFVYIDNLGAFGFDDTDSQISYDAINFKHYLDSNGATPTKLFENWGTSPNNGFTNMYKDIESGKMNTSVDVSDQAIVGVYTTYAIAGLYKDDDSSKKETIGKLGYRMNRDDMVEISKDPLDIPDSIYDDLVDDTIRNWVYYLLHPTKGLDYVRVLITNKVNSLLVGWHHDMVGTNGVGSNTGTTLYRSNTGYVTTPDLSELQWTNKLIQLYNQMVPFLIVIMIVTMLFAFIVGIFNVQKSILGVIIFACFLMTPVTLINGVVGVSNRISQNIYGEKFTYWALVQQESYASAIDEAATGDDYTNYLRTLYAENTKVYNNQGSDSIVLKWQAPKKMASLMLSSEDAGVLSGLQDSMLTKAFLDNTAYSGESYLDGDNSYLYRSYTDIGNFSRYIYNGIQLGNKRSRKTIANGWISGLNTDMKKRLKRLATRYEADRNNGYTNLNGDGSKSSKKALRTALPLTSNIYVDAVKKKGKVKNLTIDDFVGINQDVFNFSVAMFNNKNLNFKETLKANATQGNESDLKTLLDKYQDQDLTGLAGYSLMSESPFYYFSWGLYDMGMSTKASASGGYRKLLLNQAEGGFFYNNENNTELKDFMDMKTLFTYTIPYLKQGNDLVKEWDDIYGIFTYDGVTTEEGHWNDPEIKDNDELKQKYWHNLNVARLYEIYTPWVDLMYDCSYAKPETITVMGKRYVVEDPIDPDSYPSSRPMIFSESEMSDYGLTEGDLTEVERLILKCNRGMQERMFDLLNYYNFSDCTLNTAAAINCTFEFNTTFSQSTLFSGNINLYPQSFEIADFSYDAFLRFILANTLGIDMTSQEDFYSEVVKNSSTTTAIVMIVLDILSQYVLPAFKIFFLVAVFLGAVLLIIATAFKVDPQQKFVTKLFKSLVVPMVSFLLANVAFSYIISLFMGSGNNAVTQTDKVSISMGDPVVVMIAIAALDILLIVIYWKTVKEVLSSIKSNLKAVSSFMLGVYGGAVAKVGSSLTGGHTSSVNGSGNGIGGSTTSGEGDAQKGTGVESARASRRGNASKHLGSFEDNERVNDSKRRTVDIGKTKSSKSDADKEKALNEKTKAGSRRINFGGDDDNGSRDRIKQATRSTENKLDD